MRLINADVISYQIIGSSLEFIYRFKIEEAPTVDAVEIRHGYWTAVGMTYEYSSYLCSACNVRSKFNSSYCPNCGCRMDKVVEG